MFSSSIFLVFLQFARCASINLFSRSPSSRSSQSGVSPLYPPAPDPLRSHIRSPHAIRRAPALPAEHRRSDTDTHPPVIRNVLPLRQSLHNTACVLERLLVAVDFIQHDVQGRRDGMRRRRVAGCHNVWQTWSLALSLSWRAAGASKESIRLVAGDREKPRAALVGVHGLVR